MNEQPVKQTRQEIEALIVAKAWKDDAYKQKLLSNPKAIFEQELGVELAQEIRIQVLEENSTSLYLVLPVNPIEAFKKIDLSEAELEAVAGGNTVVATKIAMAYTTAFFLGAGSGVLHQLTNGSKK